MYIISQRATQGLLLWQFWEDTVLSLWTERKNEGTKNILCSGESVRFGSPHNSSIASYLGSNAWLVEIALRGALPFFPSQADVLTVTECFSYGTRAVFAWKFGGRNNVQSGMNVWASFSSCCLSWSSFASYRSGYTRLLSISCEGYDAVGLHD